MKKLIYSGMMILSLAVFMTSCADEANTAANKVGNAANTAMDKTKDAANAAAKTVGDAAKAVVPTGPLTSMEFGESTFDFGTVDEGEKVSHTYSFTNTGKEPLIISNAKGSCGCTVPQWPKEPIAPGAKGEVTVEFNSKNKKGKRNQKVTLTSNTEPAQTFIYLTGEVTPDPNAKPPATPNAAQPKIQVNQ